MKAILLLFALTCATIAQAVEGLQSSEFRSVDITTCGGARVGYSCGIDIVVTGYKPLFLVVWTREFDGSLKELAVGNLKVGGVFRTSYRPQDEYPVEVMVGLFDRNGKLMAIDGLKFTVQSVSGFKAWYGTQTTDTEDETWSP
jgi:hypothetical protein